MSLQIEKKGLSLMISYLLLVAFAVVISSMVYVWFTSYLPQESLECPEGISINVQNIICEANGISFEIRNNGLFDLDGFYILTKENSQQDLATLDISEYSNQDFNENGIIFSESLGPGEISEIITFSGLNELVQDISHIELIPIKNLEGKLTACNKNSIKKEINPVCELS